MEKVVYRKNKMFCIDKSKIKSIGNVDKTVNALYAAIYLEFSGASNNPEYANLNSLERLDKVNNFANDWLIKRGLL